MMATFICYYITTSSVVLWLMVYLTAATCPGGYTSVGSHCYKYHSSTPMTWTAGKAACRGIGATLPAIKSESERNSFMTFRSESGSTWLMAQESVNANPFEAAWLDDAPDLRPTWTDWAPSSPNGVNGDCLAIDASGKFVDESCSTSHPIYCSVRSCPTGFLRAGRFCYKDLAQSTDYFTSRTQCADENARQPMFHNQENFDDFNTWNPFPTDWTWFGAEDGQDEGNWLYTDGSKHKFFDWSNGQPDNSNNEDCAHVFGNGKFNDLNCGGSLRTMCQAYSNVDSVAYCPMLYDITKGRVAMSHAPAYETSLAWYFCDDGYAPNPVTPFLCMANGQWNTSSVTCTLPCSALSTPANGNAAQYSNLLRPEGTTATFTCAANYVLSDTTALTCLNTQNWDRSAPTCVAQCPVLSTPTDGVGPTYSDANRGPFSTASFTCDANFVLSSATVLTCNTGGIWSALVPTCIPQCPALSAPTNGNAPVYSDSERKPTATATYSCDSGNNFYLSDNTVLTCNVGHSWDRQSPVCKRDCVWNSWESWNNCTVACGGGTQDRNRVKSVVEVNGGNCIGISSDNQTCNSHPCPIDCEWASWTGFGACSKTCGGGQQSRNRQKSVLAQHGGLDCPGLPESIQDCNKDSCNPMSARLKLLADILQIVGCTILLSLLLTTNVVMIIIREISYERMFHLCQEILLALAHILILSMRDIVTNETLCVFAGISFQFLFVGNFAFLFLESIHTYTISTCVLNNNSAVRKLTWVFSGLFVPTAATVPMAYFYWRQYPSRYSCWTNLGHVLALGTFGPILICAALTVILTEASGMDSRRKRLPCVDVDQYYATMINQKGMVFILPANVCSWAFGLCALYYARVSLYFFVFSSNVALGAVMFQFHCLGTPTAVALLRRLCKR